MVTAAWPGGSVPTASHSAPRPRVAVTCAAAPAAPVLSNSCTPASQPACPPHRRAGHGDECGRAGGRAGPIRRGDGGERGGGQRRRRRDHHRHAGSLSSLVAPARQCDGRRAAHIAGGVGFSRSGACSDRTPRSSRRRPPPRPRPSPPSPRGGCVAAVGAPPWRSLRCSHSAAPGDSPSCLFFSGSPGGGGDGATVERHRVSHGLIQLRPSARSAPARAAARVGALQAPFGAPR